jgi:hypothetical protein
VTQNIEKLKEKQITNKSSCVTSITRMEQTSIVISMECKELVIGIQKVTTNKLVRKNHCGSSCATNHN